MLIQYQILQTKIIRTVWEAVRRITYEISGAKGLKSQLPGGNLCSNSLAKGQIWW